MADRRTEREVRFVAIPNGEDVVPSNRRISMMWELQAEEEFGTLSSYLEFSNNNIGNFEQEIRHELHESIDQLRVRLNIPAELTDDEIILEVETMDLAEVEVGNPWLRPAGLLDGIEMIGGYYDAFYSSFVVMCFSLLEQNLLTLCDSLGLGDRVRQVKDEKRQRRQQIPGIIILLHDLLKKAGSESAHAQFWDELLLACKLRNALVHSGLYFPMEFFDARGQPTGLMNDYRIKIPHDLQQYLISQDIYAKAIGRIVLNLDYCQHLIELLEGALHKITSGLLNLQSSEE